MAMVIPYHHKFRGWNPGTERPYFGGANTFSLLGPMPVNGGGTNILRLLLQRRSQSLLPPQQELHRLLLLQPCSLWYAVFYMQQCTHHARPHFTWWRWLVSFHKKYNIEQS